ncbi:hypothetical protein QQP08_010743 [Theobroma cacao]|nr:hypothetical protein QQP08_010743 [Theobroma cacao]
MILLNDCYYLVKLPATDRRSVQLVSLWKSLNRMSGILLKYRKEGKYMCELFNTALDQYVVYTLNLAPSTPENCDSEAGAFEIAHHLPFDPLFFSIIVFVGYGRSHSSARITSAYAPHGNGGARLFLLLDFTCPPSTRTSPKAWKMSTSLLRSQACHQFHPQICQRR